MLDLTDAGPLAQGPGRGTLIAVIDGVGLPVHGQSERRDGKMDLSFVIAHGDAARTVAKHFRIEPQRRSHPGHRIEVRVAPEKQSYRVGEPVTLTFTIRNAGDKPVAFTNGGKQRGPRDNQFRFLAYRSAGYGTAVPDTGDPTNFGGIGSVLTFQPGEEFPKTVALDKWFTFKDPDTYRVTALFELEMFDPTAASDPHGAPIWDDFAVGECLVKIVAKDN
jgi:hypothetical protein